jgi:hypothetical protein
MRLASSFWLLVAAAFIGLIQSSLAQDTPVADGIGECFKASNNFPLMFCDRVVCNGAGSEPLPAREIRARPPSRAPPPCRSLRWLAYDQIIMPDRADRGVKSPFLARRADEFVEFTTCCATSFNKTAADTIRGDGTENFECYLADGVLEPPCWVPDQTYPDVRRCYSTDDPNPCMAGERDGDCFACVMCSCLAYRQCIARLHGRPAAACAHSMGSSSGNQTATDAARQAHRCCRHNQQRC